MESQGVRVDRVHLGGSMVGNPSFRVECDKNQDCKLKDGEKHSFGRDLLRTFASTLGLMEVQVQNAGIGYGYLEAASVEQLSSDGSWVRSGRNSGLQLGELSGEAMFCPKRNEASSRSRGFCTVSVFLTSFVALCLASGGIILSLLFGGRFYAEIAAALLVVAMCVPLTPLFLFEKSTRRAVKSFDAALENMSALQKITWESLRWIRELEVAEATQRKASGVQRALTALSAVRVLGEAGGAPSLLSDKTPAPSHLSKTLPPALPLRLALKSVLEAELRSLSSVSDELLQLGRRPAKSVIASYIGCLLRPVGEVMDFIFSILLPNLQLCFWQPHAESFIKDEQTPEDSTQPTTSAPAFSTESLRACSLKHLKDLAGQVKAAQLVLCMRVKLLIKEMRLEAEAAVSSGNSSSLEAPFEKSRGSKTSPPSNVFRRSTQLRRALMAATEDNGSKKGRSLEAEMREALDSSAPASQTREKSPLAKKESRANGGEALKSSQRRLSHSKKMLSENRKERNSRRKDTATKDARLDDEDVRLVVFCLLLLRAWIVRFLKDVQRLFAGSISALGCIIRLAWLRRQLSLSADCAFVRTLSVRFRLEEEFLCFPACSAPAPNSSKFGARGRGREGGKEERRCRRPASTSRRVALSSVSRRLGAALSLLRLPLPVLRLEECRCWDSELRASSQTACSGESDLEYVLRLTIANLRDALQESERILSSLHGNSPSSPAPSREKSADANGELEAGNENERRGSASGPSSEGQVASGSTSDLLLTWEDAARDVSNVFEVYTAKGAQSSSADMRRKEEEEVLSLMDGTDAETREKSVLALQELKLRLKEKEAARSSSDAPPRLLREIRLSVEKNETNVDAKQPVKERVSLQVRQSFLSRGGEASPRTSLSTLEENAEPTSAREEGAHLTQNPVSPEEEKEKEKENEREEEGVRSNEEAGSVAEALRECIPDVGGTGRLLSLCNPEEGEETQEEMLTADEETHTPLPSALVDELFAAQNRRRRRSTDFGLSLPRTTLPPVEDEGWEKCDVFEAVGENDDVPVWVVGVAQQKE